MTVESADGTVDVTEAWRELGERLRGYVRRRVAPADADDIVQSVMVKLLERRDALSSESLRPWLFTVTRNAVVDYYRGRPAEVDMSAFEDFPEKSRPTDTLGALSDCLDPMLRTLNPSDGELLRRIDIDGMQQTLLAEQLGIPLSTLKSRVQRARTKLRAAFDACCSIELSREGSPVSFVAPPGCGGTDEGCGS